jgi:hypothetical protein
MPCQLGAFVLHLHAAVVLYDPLCENAFPTMQEALQQDAAAPAQEPMPTLKPGLGGPVAKGINWLLGLFEKKPGDLAAS